MTISAPSKLCFYISLVLFILAILGTYVGAVSALAPYAIFLFIGAWVVLALGNLMKGF